MNHTEWSGFFWFKRSVSRPTDLESWRTWLLDAISPIAAVAFALSMLATFPVFIEKGLYGLMALDAGVFLVLVGRLFTKGGTYKGRAYLWLGMIYAMAVSFYVALGPHYARSAWLVMAVVMTALLFGTRAAVVATVLNATILMTLYWSMGPDNAAWATIYSEAFGNWMMFVVNLSFLTVACGLPVGFLLNRLDTALKHERNSLENLSVETKKVHEAYEALQSEKKEREEAEKALKESEDKFRSITENAADYIFIKDKERKYTFVNQAMKDLLGLTHEEVLGKTPEEVFGFEQASIIREVDDRAFSGVTVNDTRSLTANNTSFFFNTIQTPLSIEDGEVTSIMGIVRDVTEQKQVEEELRQSEERFRKVFEEGPIGMAVLSLDEKFNDVNNAFCGMLGYTKNELIGLTFLDITHPDDIDSGKRQARRLLSGEIPFLKTVKRYITQGGRTVWVNLTASIIRGNEGTPLYKLTMIEDITERRQVEEALRRSEQRYRFLYNRTPVMLHSIDKEGRLTNVNEYWLETLGYEIAEVIGKKSTDFLTENSRKFAERTVLPRFFKDGFIKEIPYQMVKKNGEVIDILLSAASERDDLNQVLGSLAVIEDITERKKSEELLKREKEKFRVLVDESPLGVSLIGKDGRYVYLNPKFTELFGYTLRDIPTGRDWFSKAYPDPKYKNKVISLWIEDLKESRIGESRPREFKVRCKDSTEKTVHFRPVTLDNGDQLVIYEDATEKKRLETQLLQSQKMEAIGTLTGGIAHDFNNMLQSILGYTQILLLDMQGHALEAGKLKKIEAGALRASELTQQLLTFSRRVESKLRPVDLNQEVRQVEKLLRRTIPRMIDIELHLASELSIIHADATQIEQVIMNLSINARDAMPEGGKLTLRTDKVTLDEAYCRAHLEAVPGDYVLLSISDTGFGMDEKTLEHIFEPFFTTKDSGKGTGLGLAMVHGIVKNHGGYIMCFSEHKEGTIFNIYFPVVKEVHIRVPEQQDRVEVGGGTEKILLVDDEKSIREVAQDMLRRFGYSVLTAPDGETALEIYRKKKEAISLIILDLIMPGMSGHRCLEKILDINPKQKVIMASGYSVNGPMEEAFEKGAKGYLQKPYELGPMLSAVREVLDRE